MNCTDIDGQKKISQNHYFWGNGKKLVSVFFVFHVYFKMRQNTKPNTLIITFFIFFFSSR